MTVGDIYRVAELGGGNNCVFCKAYGNGINVDVMQGEKVDVVANFEEILPLPDGEFDLVFSRYVLEHVSWRKVEQFISEIYRILKSEGQAIVVTANMREQAKVLVANPDWTLDKDVCMVFGNQDYPDNTHRSSMSPELAEKLFKKVGFKIVSIKPLSNCATDMEINVKKNKDVNKMKEIHDGSLTLLDGTIVNKGNQNQHPYTRAYFDGEGYRGCGFYRDFPQHYATADYVLKKQPASVLELGGGRGYVCKILQANGIKATCMDISKHCWYTRAANDFIMWDARVVPWQTFLVHNDGLVTPKEITAIPDQKYDLCFSIAFLEHISEDKLEPMMKEMARVTKRGFHGITFTDPNMNDKTHQTLRPKEWWIQKFKETVPNYPVEIVDKEDLEKLLGDSNYYTPSDGLVKLNVGAFQDMFFYGWTNIDVIDLREWARLRGYIFESMDVTTGIKRQDNTVDIILASHFIEHLTRGEGEAFVKECFRVLKPDGLLRLAIPDSKIICKQYLDGTIMENAKFNISVENAKDDAQALFELLLSGHKTVYDAEGLIKLLEKTFTHVEEKTFDSSNSTAVEKQTIGMYPSISTYVEAKKPQLSTPEPTWRSGTIANWTFNTEKQATIAWTRDRLKIALISTPFLRTPPDSYGGLEMVVADLGEALAELGHDVTVFAANGSKVEGCNVVEFGEPKLKVQVDWVQAEKEAYEIYKNMLKEFDIIHGHNWLGFEFLAKSLSVNQSLKVCHTHHGHLNTEWWGRSKPPFKLNLIGISQWMSMIYKSQGFDSRFVYNGVNLKKYVPKERKSGRLLYVGRLDKFKQPHLAIEVAKKMGLSLDIVGGTFVQDVAYLQQIRDMCDGTQIVFHPDASHQKKLELMQNAKCLLFPSQMGEPFGLVAVEAMACGTVVVALNDGAIEEVVKEGGFVCRVFDKKFTDKGMTYIPIADPVATMIEAVKRVHTVSFESCLANAGRFSRENMAKNYISFYQAILSGVEW